MKIESKMYLNNKESVEVGVMKYVFCEATEGV